MMIFVDTSALLAVSFFGDKFHASAAQTWSALIARGEELVCNNYTIVETVSLLQRRFGLQVIINFLENIAPALQIYWVEESQHEAAMQALLIANRRELSLVDCASFETMRRLGIRTAFTFDPHFRQLGYELAAGE